MKYTYKQAGVDVKKGDEFAKIIKENVNIPEWILKEPTGYATVLLFTTPPIAVTADGIGTKILLHIEHGT
ncbi:MAG TPA: phosphoribosylformylglycinamidine cyclo-ligase, partial [Thermosipho africanus]|nr:phosphoribosylformylglycinamidine cyclo-ligase [Thermosipho africanus]